MREEGAAIKDEVPADTAVTGADLHGAVPVTEYRLYARLS